MLRGDQSGAYPEGESGVGFTKPAKSIGQSVAEAAEADEGDESLERAEYAEGEEPGDGEGLEASEDDGEDESSILPKGKGTKDKPYSHADMPKDKFIEIKVDGTKKVVSMHDLTRGYIAEQTFERRVGQATHAQKEAELYIKAAVQQLENFKNANGAKLDQLFSDGNKLLAFVMEHVGADEADKFARGYAQHLYEWKQDPSARSRWEYERQQRQLAVDRKKFEAEKQSTAQQLAQQKRLAAENATLLPARDEAFKELGFPEGAKIPPKFVEAVNHYCTIARRANGGKLDPADLKEAILKANSFFPLPTVKTRKPAPAPAPNPKSPIVQRKAANGKQVDWSKVPYNQRVSNPDFYLSKMSGKR